MPEGVSSSITACWTGTIQDPEKEEPRSQSLFARDGFKVVLSSESRLEDGEHHG